MEQHLASHDLKHVRDWAAKTSPAPATATSRARNVDPEKAKARAAAREQRQAQRAQERETRQQARAEKGAQRTALREQRAKAIAERKQARAEKHEQAAAQLHAAGAPVKDGKLDKARVPGATKDFQPLTTLDPENGYRGRSYQARSAGEMGSELLGAAAHGGTNEQILLRQLGNMSARDKAQWEGIAEKYESGPIETYDDAVRVLAKASAGNGVRPDWRNFDFEALQACPGLERLQPPKWLQDAQTDREAREHMHRAYEEAGAHHDEDEEIYNPPIHGQDDGDIPFER